jgi:DNA-binding NarL/FixJ family response regulator
MSTSTEPVRILLADDHRLFREGLASLLEREPDLHVVGQAVHGAEAVALAEQHQPDVVLMDIQMPICTGLEATQRLLTIRPDLKIIMLTVSDKDQDLFAAVKAGAQGYLLKGSTSATELVTAVRRVAAGEAIIAPTLAPFLLAEFNVLAQQQTPSPARTSTSTSTITPDDHYPDARNVLTERELEVLQLVAQGLKNREVADQLVISENTVRTHLRNILDKLHVQNRLQAATLYQRQDIIQSD